MSTSVRYFTEVSNGQSAGVLQEYISKGHAVLGYEDVERSPVAGGDNATSVLENSNPKDPGTVLSGVTRDSSQSNGPQITYPKRTNNTLQQTVHLPHSLSLRGLKQPTNFHADLAQTELDLEPSKEGLTHLTDTNNLVPELDGKGEPVFSQEGLPVLKPRLDERKWKQLKAIEKVYDNNMQRLCFTKSANENLSRRWEARQLRVDLARQLQIEIQLIEGLRGKLDSLNQQLQQRKKQTEDMQEEQQREAEAFRERIRNLRLKHENSETRCREHIAELGSLNEAVREYREQRAHLVSHLEENQCQLVRENTELEQRLNRAANKHKLEKNGLKYALIQSIHRAKTKLVSATHEQLHPTTRRLMQENVATGAELQFQSSSLSRLRRRAGREAALCAKLEHAVAILRAEKSRNAARLRLLRELISNLQTKSRELEVQIRNVAETEGNDIQFAFSNGVNSARDIKTQKTVQNLPNIWSKGNVNKPATLPLATKANGWGANAIVLQQQQPKNVDYLIGGAGETATGMGVDYGANGILSVRGLESRLQQLRIQIRHAHGESLAAADEVVQATKLRDSALKHLDLSARFILQCMDCAHKILMKAKEARQMETIKEMQDKLASGDIAGAQSLGLQLEGKAPILSDNLISKQSPAYVQDFLISTIQPRGNDIDGSAKQGASIDRNKIDEEAVNRGLSEQDQMDKEADKRIGIWKVSLLTPEERVQILDLWFLLMSNASNYGAGSSGLAIGFEPVDPDEMPVPAKSSRPGRPISASESEVEMGSANSDRERNIIKSIPISAVDAIPSVDPKISEKLVATVSSSLLFDDTVNGRLPISNEAPMTPNDTEDVDELSQLLENLKQLGVIRDNQMHLNGTPRDQTLSHNNAVFKFGDEEGSATSESSKLNGQVLFEAAHKHRLMLQALGFAKELKSRDENFGRGNEKTEMSQTTIIPEYTFSSDRPVTPRHPYRNNAVDFEAEFAGFGTGAATPSGDLRQLPSAYLLSVMDLLNNTTREQLLSEHENASPQHEDDALNESGEYASNVDHMFAKKSEPLKRQTASDAAAAAATAAASIRAERAKRYFGHTASDVDEDDMEEDHSNETERKWDVESQDGDSSDASQVSYSGGIQRRKRQRKPTVHLQLRKAQVMDEDDIGADEVEEVEDELETGNNAAIGTTGTVEAKTNADVIEQSNSELEAQDPLQVAQARVKDRITKSRAELESQLESHLENREAIFDLSLAMRPVEEDSHTQVNPDLSSIPTDVEASTLISSSFMVGKE